MRTACHRHSLRALLELQYGTQRCAGHVCGVYITVCCYCFVDVHVLSIDTNGLVQWSGHLGASRLGWQCGYSLKDDQDFARLRRMWREHHAEFSGNEIAHTHETLFHLLTHARATAHWRTLDLRQMRLSLFRVAPLTLDDTDELLPVARQLLPDVNVSEAFVCVMGYCGAILISIDSQGDVVDE